MIEAARLGAFVPEHFNPWAVIVQTVAILSWTASVFLAGYLWLNKQNATSRYLSDASYWIYLSHVPILLYIQLPLINTDLSVFLKFIISVCATLGIGLISYHYLVRGTVIGLLLNGKRTAHATNQYVVNQNTN
ncbi:hypothetical protein PA25_25510 [Pseudoalteromonas sp. A25]|nr:hypothetical protein PA25_25510 [Pseudoalteromonas sp. A25]